jgi:hypothetical protein
MNLFISGDISIALTDAKNQDLPFTIDDNQDGTFTINYTPKSPGVHCISVLFGDNEIPISPIKVNVEPSIDINKIRIEGLETSKLFFCSLVSIRFRKRFLFSTNEFFFLLHPYSISVVNPSAYRWTACSDNIEYISSWSNTDKCSSCSYCWTNRQYTRSYCNTSTTGISSSF